MYEMDFRQYDPALARWVVIDPIIHFNLSPYNAFDNNPIFWADPSGADGVPSYIAAMFNATAAGTNSSWYNNNDGTFSSSSGLLLETDTLDMYNEGEMLPGISITVYGGSFNGLAEAVQAHTYKYGSVYRYLENQDSNGVGQPGTLESMIPFWGSGRAAVDHFQNGNYWQGAFYTALAISDVFLVKSLVTGLAKGGVQAISKGLIKKEFTSWTSYRRLYLKTGFAKPNQPLHHWLIQQNGPIGRYVPNSIKNQMWNLKNFSSASMHMRAGHGRNWAGQQGYNLLGQLYYGTPAWPKLAIASYGGRGGAELTD